MPELPELTVPPSPSSLEEGEDPPSGMFARPQGLIAVDVRPLPAAARIQTALLQAGRFIVGPDAIPSASIVVADVSANDFAARVSQLRARMDASAALIVVTPEDEPQLIPQAHRLGAAACLRLPVIAEELLATVGRFITSRETEEKLARLSRELDLQAHLASLGRVASGIGHEIANPLSSVLANLPSLREGCQALRLESTALRSIVGSSASEAPAAIARAQRLLGTSAGEEVLEIIGDISDQCERMADLLSLMRELAARRPRTIESMELSEVARSASSLCPADLLEGVKLDVVIDATAVVQANRMALEQIVLNLLTNAAFFARKLTSPQVRLHVYSTATEGIVSVRDNGPGIPEQMQDRVFEPFFTTRRGEGGTGLGLALCREYASQMGGRISLWSVLGRGACFRVHLRRAGVPR